MTDLVKRLRDDWPEILVEKHWMMDSDAIEEQRKEAADRIEQLEAALRYIYGNGDGRGCNPQLMINAAGAALGDKQ